LWWNIYDYFQASFKVNNKGPKGAYITQVTLRDKEDILPGLNGATELGINRSDFGVMVNGKPSAVVNPDTKTKQPFIPVGQTGVITVNLFVQGWNLMLKIILLIKKIIQKNNFMPIC
jgi:hypothetical protein